MNIVTFTSSLGHSGGVRQALYQTQCLRRMGHNAMLCLPHESHMWAECVEDGAGFWRLPLQERDWKEFLEARLSSGSGGGQGIVHAFHNRAVKLAAWWGLGWRRRGIACVAHRGIITRPKNPLPYWSPGIRLFLANSQACARSLNWYCPSFRVRVVPNGVPDERVRPQRSAAEMRALLGLSDFSGMILGCTLNQNPIKGGDILIRAFARALRHPEMGGVRLLTLGMGAEFLQPLLARAGVADKVIVVDHSRHVSDELQLCDAFVFPSRGMDSAPNALLEAVRMGLPVVSTDVGGCPDIVDNNGILVPAGNESALADAMTRICLDHAQRALWASQSLIVGSRYTVENRCHALLDLYSTFSG